MGYLLGIDIGTSGTKTVLFDFQGNTIASALSEYPLYQERIGWAEQEPEDWWNACVTSIRAVIEKSGIDASAIAGVGLSGQMHGIVLLDENDKVLRRSIIWCDQRTQKECEQITDMVGYDKLIDITANPALTGFSAGKVMWVKNNEPEIYAQIKHILLPKDYIRFKLTGEFASEVSDASGMQFLDVKNRCWSKELLDILGVDINWLGKMYESYEISGQVSKCAAEATGLKVGTPVAGGAGDQAAGAVGNGIVEEGIISSTIGTSGVVFAHMNKLTADEKGRLQAFCHAVPGAWHVFGCANASGLSLQWFRNNFCQSEKTVAEFIKKDPYELICKQAENVPIGSNGLIYLPYLMGERTPHLDNDAKGVFFGLSAKHTRAEMIRSIMEGVVFSLNDALNLIENLGVKITQVRASGGGGKNPLWRQMQADIFNKEVATVKSSEGPALGVALLAGVGAGIYSSVPDACKEAVLIKTTQMPDEKAVAEYKKYSGLFDELYPALKEKYKRLTEILNN